MNEQERYTSIKYSLYTIIGIIFGGVLIYFGFKAVFSNPHPCTKPGIKGNISSSGEKIYHLVGQRFYSSTKIDESMGERMFCTEDDAIKAGWRKSER